MKLADKAVERFLARPDPAVRAVLVYGPDSGLVTERCRALVTSVAGDATDPFRVTELDAAAFVADPARLADEAAAISMTGGRRAVWLRRADGHATELLADFLDDPPGDALVVVEAGELSSSAALRRLFESSKVGAALPCYRDNDQNLPGLIRATLRQAGLEVAPDALAFLLRNLGGDRAETRQALEKLALYKGAGRIELEDAEAVVGDQSELALEALAFAVGAGRLGEVERLTGRCLAAGDSPVAILRAVSRHILRLHLVAGALAGGEPYDSAVRRLRPGPFWKVAGDFREQAGAWTPAALAGASETLMDAEARCKESGAPAELIAARALLEVAARAASRARSRNN